jgi:hypothetical protein
LLATIEDEDIKAECIKGFKAFKGTWNASPEQNRRMTPKERLGKDKAFEMSIRTPGSGRYSDNLFIGADKDLQILYGGGVFSVHSSEESGAGNTAFAIGADSRSIV